MPAARPHARLSLRLAALAALTALGSTVLLVLPTLAPAAAGPRPVPPRISHLALTPADSDLPTARPRASAIRATPAFMALGVTWAPSPAAEPEIEPEIEVRTRGAAGWSDWTLLQAHTEDAPDPDEEARAGAALRPGTAMLWTGPSDAVQTRVSGTAGLRDLRLELIDPGTSPADDSRATSGAAHAGEARPGIISRAQWGADESMRRGDPTYSSSVKVGFVHHTASSSSYTSAQAAAQVRAIYAYHTKSQGWDDIGYNFLVDRFGRVYEGRSGGVDRPVIGAHTGGFNRDSFGVSLLGTYSTVAPPAAAQSALSKTLAWKLGLHHRDPLGKASLISAGGGTSKFPAGQVVSFNVVSGHRDAGSTSCPGAATYARLPQIRSSVKSLLGAGFVNPQLSSASVQFPATSTRVQAGSLTALSWTASITAACSPGVIRAVSGSTPAGGRLDAELLLRDDANTPLLPGSYRVVLSGRNGTDPAHTAVMDLEIVPPVRTLSPQTATPAPSAPAGFTPLAPVRLLDTRTGEGTDHPHPLGAGQRLDVQVAGRAGVPAGASSVVVNLTGVCPHAPSAVTAWAAHTPPPPTTSLSLEKGVTRAGLTTVQLSPEGRISLRATALTHLVVDVVGYHAPSGGTFRPLAPRRVLDTRTTQAPLAAGELRRLALAAVEGTGVPREATGVVVNLTVVPKVSGHLTAFPGGDRPATSSLNFLAGQPVANRAVVGLDGGGITLTSSAPDTHIVVDVVGWYGPHLEGDAGSTLTALPPARLLDTRKGTGTSAGRRSPGQLTELQLAGRGGVPLDAREVVLSLTGDATRRTHVTVYPAGTPLPNSSDLNLEPYLTGTNLVLVPLAGGRLVLRDAAGSAHLAADVVGFYR